MGMLEQIAADVAEMKETLAAMNASAGSAEESKPKTPTAAEKKAAAAAEKKAADKKKAAEKTEESKSEYTAEDVRSKFLALQSSKGDDVAKSVITGLGYKKLAELIADAENWDKAIDAAQEAMDAEEEDDNGGL